MSSSSNDPYSVLGLTPGAPIEEVRATYRKLALKWHPDRHVDDKTEAAEKFVEIHDAYLAITEAPPADPTPAPNPRPRHPERSRSRYASVPDDAFPNESSASRKEDIYAEAPRHTARSASSTTLSTNAHASSHVASSQSRPPATHRHTDSVLPHSTKRYTQPLSSKASTPSLSSTRSARDPVRTELAHSSSRSKSHADLKTLTPERPRLARSASRSSVSRASRSSSTSRESNYVHVPRHDSSAPLDPPLQPLSPPKPATRKSDASEWTFPLDLSLEELYTGTSQKFRISTGADGAHQNVRVVIPPGCKPGTRIHALPTVTFEVREKPHGYFRRVPNEHSADLFMAVEMPWSPGSEWPTGHVAFTGVDGHNMKVPLPANLVLSSQGSRVLGKGMPKWQGAKVTGYGDLIIRWDLINTDAAKSADNRSRWDALKKVLHFGS